MSLLFDRLLQQSAPSAPILIEGDIQWSLTDLREKAVRLASALQAQGIAPGDRVAIMFMNQKEYLVSFFAILFAGGVVVPINITMPPDDILYVVTNSGSKLVLTTETFAPAFEGKPIPILMANQIAPERFPSWEQALENGSVEFQPGPQPAADTMRILMYTSGTTGRPKGVMLSEENLLGNMDGIHPVFHLDSSERMLLALPLFHAYGQIIALYALQCQCPLVLVPNFAPKKILHALIEHNISVLPLVPTMFSVLLNGIQKMGRDALPHLKFCISGGASLPAPLLNEIEGSLHIKIMEGYGLTETSPVLAVNGRERGSIARSVGQPLPNLTILLRDEQGNTVPVTSGEQSAEGEICVQGPNVMLGYYNLPEDTQAAFDSEGYFKTGDLGSFDADGNLYISGGRIKDLIIKAGENIAPVRIEDVISQHPAVQTVAVIGIPDDKLGEDIMACIEFRPDQSVTDSDLKKFCREQLPPFMVPALIRVYDELPKNQTGKIIKKQLKTENANALQKHEA